MELEVFSRSPRNLNIPMLEFGNTLEFSFVGIWEYLGISVCWNLGISWNIPMLEFGNILEYPYVGIWEYLGIFVCWNLGIPWNISFVGIWE